MNRMFLLSFAVLLAFCTGVLAAQEPIRMARTPDISPDGKLVAFSYQDDLWVVDSIGGTARAITSHPAHDLYPSFSPDGKEIAFSANRHGGYDVYVVSVRGGRPRRLTFHESADHVCGWSPDGKSILFASARSVAFPRDWELFSIPATGGRARQLTRTGGKEGQFSPDGKQMVYVRGPGSWYRKGYRGSSNDEIWIASAEGKNHRKLTTFNGQDSSPMWSPDGKTIYYVSEYHGTPANLVAVPVHQALVQGLSALPMNPAGTRVKPRETHKPRQMTFHKEGGVRKARISKNGEWIVYECGADLWMVATRAGAMPRKLAIEAFADYKTNPEKIATFSSGATEYALAPGEKHVAFAVHGKLFLRPVSSKGKVIQLTHGASNDHGIAWAPNASRILFLSDRNGHEDIYTLEADDPKHSKFLEAHRFKTRQLTKTRETEMGLSFSPDGKRIAFVRAGKLVTMKPDGTDEKILVPEPRVIDYEWSPDARWLVYSRVNASYASEMYIIPSTGPTAENPVRNITRYATYNAGITWSANGKKLAFLSRRRGDANLYVLDLRKPAAEGVTEKKSKRVRVNIDWEDIHLRAKPVVSKTAAEAAISPDGSQVAFRDSATGDLWLASTSGSDLKRLTTGKKKPRQIRWSRRKSSYSGYFNLLYFRDGSGNIYLLRPSTSSSSKTSLAKLPFKIRMTIRTQDMYHEMFDQSWRYLAANFYDGKFHGKDWDAVKKRYRPLVKHVSRKEDLYALLYLMMGELNASHLGVSGHITSPDESTGQLGLLYDDEYKGPGVKVAEILKRGPADRRGLDLQVGDVILSIDDTEIKPTTDICHLLNGKVDSVVTVEVSSDPKSGKRRTIEIKATSRSKVKELMYERWVEDNAQRVAKLSKGKLGYIHIPSMDEEGLDRFVRALYSDCFDKEAIVLDVRYNSGGYTHDRVLNYLGGKEHTFFRPREGGQGLVLRSSDRKWTKPVVVLINNRSYSDAEIFPNAFRTLGLGKLVGQPTGGFVIGTTSVRLIDGSRLRLPRTGVYTTKGVNMEREGVQPDVVVIPHPNDLAKGLDPQLNKAVEVLQREVVVWKKNRDPKFASKSKGGAPAPTPMTPAP